MDDIYHVPKYKPGDMVIFKWPMYQETPDDLAFQYRYYIILFVSSHDYEMLRLDSGTGHPEYVTYALIEDTDRFEGKVLYHIDADKIRDLCCEGPQI